MVQKEVKKKTKIYGTVAVLSALVLVTMVYAFGAAPIFYPPAQVPTVSGMQTFSSLDDLKNFLTTNSYSGSSSFGGGPLDAKFFSSIKLVPTSAPASTSSGPVGATGATGTLQAPAEYGVSSNDYSTTNIQVAGVDEADTVKTDGQYIYTVSSIQNGGYNYYGSPSEADNAVYIINANPQNAQVVSKINLGNDTEPAGIFLSQDSSKLVVLASKYQIYPLSISSGGDSNAPVSIMLAPYRSNVYTYIDVYDISNKASPVLTRNFTVTGSYFNSRMIGNYVYAVVSQPASLYDNVVTLPAVYDGAKESGLSPTAIYYSPANQSSYYSFTSFYGLDIMDDALAPTNMTVMMDGASTMYVSANNIYVTSPTWTDNGQYTDIYRVGINGLQLTFQAKGSVPGSVLNQYAMDEYNGYFRIATNWWGGTQLNNVYVLDSNLAVVGKLEGLAQGENLHSVRFMGDRCYLVTFIQTDPLFVIDLSQPTNPKVLGELQISGYSDYLYPYDATHLIGIGKEAVASTQQSFAWYQGIKLSLFDVSDVNHPVQLANVTIGDRGTDSPVLSDPKAFLFDQSKNLLVIPISLAIVDNSTQAQVPTFGQEAASVYGQTVWQGAYVYSLTLDGGFVLKGTITHLDSSLLNSQGYLIDPNNYWSTQNQWITRALYIGNTLYTLSNGEVKLNSLTDLSQIAQVNLQ